MNTLKAIAEGAGLNYSTFKFHVNKYRKQGLTRTAAIKKAKQTAIPDRRSPLRIEVEAAGMDFRVYGGRIRRGWSHERAMNTPVVEKPPISKRPDPVKIQRARKNLTPAEVFTRCMTSST